METASELPPYPAGILDWSEEQKRVFIYEEKEGENNEEMFRRKIAHKLGLIWAMWGEVRNNKEVINIINKPGTGRLLTLQNVVVMILDNLGKILGSSDIMKELVFLAGNKDARPVGETLESGSLLQVE